MFRKERKSITNKVNFQLYYQDYLKSQEKAQYILN